MSVVTTTIITSSQSIDLSFEAYLVDASSDNVTLTLMDNTSGNNGAMYVKRIDGNGTNAVIVQGFNDSQTIDGQSKAIFSPGQDFRIVAYNGLWYSIS